MVPIIGLMHDIMRAMHRMWLLALVACGTHARVVAQTSDVRVTVHMPGRTATELDTTVALPLAHALAWAHTRTTARAGVVTVDVASTDIHRVQQAVEDADLPSDARPEVEDRAGERLATRYIVRSTDPLTVATAKHAQWMVEVQQLPGVRRIEVCGEQPEVTTINVDPQRMQLGTSVHQIADAIESSHPSGDALPDLVVGRVADHPIRLRDVATIAREAKPGGCLARDQRSGIIVGEVWTSTGTIHLPPPPPGLEIDELPRDTLTLTVDDPGMSREAAFVIFGRLEGIIEADGSERRLLVQPSTAPRWRDPLRQLPGIVVHEPPSIVVGVLCSDPAVLADAATAIEHGLGAHADGVIGIGDRDDIRLELDRPALARANIDAPAPLEAWRAASDEGLDVDARPPAVIRLYADDPMRIPVAPGVALPDVVKLVHGREPQQVIRLDSTRWLGVRARGNADEIANLVKRVKLPPSVVWQLER